MKFFTVPGYYKECIFSPYQSVIGTNQHLHLSQCHFHRDSMKDVTYTGVSLFPLFAAADFFQGKMDQKTHLFCTDLQLTPEMYNQLRGLQKKAKDLRQEVRNLRRMSQAQAHSVRETIRDTFIKIRFVSDHNHKLVLHTLELGKGILILPYTF